MRDLAIGWIAGGAYVVASTLVFVLGSSYYNLFRTNRSWLFKLALLGVSIPVAWVLLRSDGNPAFGLLAFGFLAASTANLAGAAVSRLHRPLKLKDDSIRGIALAKGLEALAVVGTILVLALVARVPFSSLYLRIGRWDLGLAIGLGGFALFAVLAWQQGRSMGIKGRTVFRLLPWIRLFVFANAFMEELWFRAIFLRPLVSLVGPVAAVALTAVVFTVAHVGATYLSKAERIRFLAILLPLGLAWGASIYFTDSIIASTLFHAGADLMVINGFIAAIHGRKPELERSPSVAE